MKRALLLLLAVAALAAASHALATALDRAGVGFVLLSAGPHSPAWALTGAAALVALRLALHLVTPGALLTATALLLQSFLRRAATPPVP